jgi:hypothetical protein
LWLAEPPSTFNTENLKLGSQPFSRISTSCPPSPFHNARMHPILCTLFFLSTLSLSHSTPGGICFKTTITIHPSSYGTRKQPCTTGYYYYSCETTSIYLGSISWDCSLARDAHHTSRVTCLSFFPFFFLLAGHAHTRTGM